MLDLFGGGEISLRDLRRRFAEAADRLDDRADKQQSRNDNERQHDHPDQDDRRVRKQNSAVYRLHRYDIAYRADNRVVFVGDHPCFAHGRLTRAELAAPEGVAVLSFLGVLKVGHFFTLGRYEARGGDHDSARGIDDHDAHFFLLVEVLDVVSRRGGKVVVAVAGVARKNKTQLIARRVELCFDAVLEHIGDNQNQADNNQHDNGKNHAQCIEHPSFRNTADHRCQPPFLLIALV